MDSCLLTIWATVVMAVTPRIPRLIELQWISFFLLCAFNKCRCMVCLYVYSVYWCILYIHITCIVCSLPCWPVQRTCEWTFPSSCDTRMNGLSFGDFENSSFDSLYSRIAQGFCGASLACQMAQSQSRYIARGSKITFVKDRWAIDVCVPPQFGVTETDVSGLSGPELRVPTSRTSFSWQSMYDILYLSLKSSCEMTIFIHFLVIFRSFSLIFSRLLGGTSKLRSIFRCHVRSRLCQCQAFGAGLVESNLWAFGISATAL